jgi:glycerophosphoryl diester phosphodiesterase
MLERGFSPEAFPVVVAHRGASVDLPENTQEAFQGALDAGADAVELDVRLTSDGIPVVMHDPHVSRTTDGVGGVHELTLAEVKRLDASGGLHRAGGRTEVPTLREVLDLLSGRAAVNLEIKNIPGEPSFDSPREAAVRAALDELEAAAFAGPVLISSFNWLSIERSQELAPDVPTGFLSIAAVAAHAALDYVRQHGHAFVLPNVAPLEKAGQGLVAEAHQDGIRVGTWTVDEPETLATLFSWGVDAVASNDPLTAVGVRDRTVGRAGAGPRRK